VPVVQSLHNYRLLCPNALFLRDGHVCEDCLGKTLAWPAIQHGCYRGSRAATGVLAGTLALHRLKGTWIHKVDRYIALTEFAREKLIAGGLPADQIAVKPNFVPSSPSPGNGEGQFALFVGRLSAEKGTQVLLEAWRHLQQAVPLKIVGGGPQADLVRQAAAADRRIEWLGRRTPEGVLELMSQALVLIIPSICYEVCPKSLLESLAVGTPVLASRLGALAELVEDGRTGRHFTPGDPHDLADQLQRMLANRYALEAMRRAAREEFLQKYTAERNYQLLIEIYQSVVRAPAALPPEVCPNEPVLST
jgi:glycosyltransferase involved in cell wall biosynthesis